MMDVDELVTYDSLRGPQADPVLRVMQHTALMREAAADRAPKIRYTQYDVGAAEVDDATKFWKSAPARTVEWLHQEKIDHVFVFYGTQVVGLVAFRPICQAAQQVVFLACGAEPYLTVDANHVTEIVLVARRLSGQQLAPGANFMLRDLPGLARGYAVLRDDTHVTDDREGYFDECIAGAPMAYRARRAPPLSVVTRRDTSLILRGGRTVHREYAPYQKQPKRGTRSKPIVLDTLDSTLDSTDTLDLTLDSEPTDTLEDVLSPLSKRVTFVLDRNETLLYPFVEPLYDSVLLPQSDEVRVTDVTGAVRSLRSKFKNDGGVDFMDVHAMDKLRATQYGAEQYEDMCFAILQLFYQYDPESVTVDMNQCPHLQLLGVICEMGLEPYCR